MFLSTLKFVAAVLSVAVVAGTHHGLALAQEKTIMPDLKALADGKAGSIPTDATLGLLSEEGDLCREGRLVLRHN
jgi:hypothetical protein